MSFDLRPFNDSVVTEYRDNWGNAKQELNPDKVQQAISNASSQIQTLVDHLNFMHRKLGDLKDVNNFMQWIDQVHPELKRDYVISQRVASRLEEGPGEAVCEAG